MERKFALIIGNSRYDDAKLANLKAPDADVSQLSELLRDSGIGAFDNVLTLTNPNMAEAQENIADFFAAKNLNDLLLLYFSGHGVLDERGRLYLAVKNTRRERLSGTALPAHFITDEMDGSRSKRQVFILDCCHSGAFSRGTKAATDLKAVTQSTFQGKGSGRIVLTATDSTEVAWEGDKLIGNATNSLFTHYLIEGLKTGAADMNGDGLITPDELYDYAYDEIRMFTPKQTPGKWTYKQQGEIILAKNPHPPQRRKIKRTKYGTIKIKVYMKWDLSAQRASIYIDDKEVASPSLNKSVSSIVTSLVLASWLRGKDTEDNEPIEIPLEIGHHTIFVKYNVMTSNILSVHIKESETVSLKCRVVSGTWTNNLILEKTA